MMYPGSLAVSGLTISSTPTEQPSQGWWDPGLLPSSIRPPISPLYPQPSGGALGFVSHNPTTVCCPTDARRGVQPRQRGACKSSTTCDHRMKVGLPPLSPTFLSKFQIIGAAFLISCVTAPVHSRYPYNPTLLHWAESVFSWKSVRRLHVTLENILPSALSIETDLNGSRFVGFFSLRPPSAEMVSVSNLWITFYEDLSSNSCAQFSFKCSFNYKVWF